MQGSAPGLVRRFAWRAAPVLALVVVFAFASVLGFVIHLDTKPGRRLVTKATNELVSELLISDLHIERIDVLSPTRLFVSRVELFDRLGKPVLVAEGLDVRFGLVSLLRGILGEKDVRVVIPDVRAEKVAFALTRDPKTGDFTVETAFEPVPSPPSGTPSKPFFLALSHIHVKQATVTTNLSGLEQVAATVSPLDAGLDVSPKGLVLSLASDGTRVARLFRRDVTGRLRSELRFPGTTRANLDGRLGNAPVVASVALRGAELELALDSPGLSPEAMREVFGTWPLLAPLVVKARASGKPSAMNASTEGRLGPATFSGAGPLVLGPVVSTDLDVRVRGLDARSFDEAAPETKLDADAHVSIRYDGELRVEATATLPESTVSGQFVPATKVQVTFARGTLDGTLTVLEPALATTVDFQVAPDGRIEFSSKSSNVDLAALAHYGVEAKGRASVRSQGVLERGELSATVDATVSGGSASGVSAKTATVHGRVTGPVAKPSSLAVELAAEGEGLDAAGFAFGRFRATSKGSGTRQAVTFQGSSGEDGELEASANLALGGGATLDGVRVEARRGDGAVTIQAERVALGAGGVTVKNLSLGSGEGALTGSITARGARRIVDFTITNLDIARLLRDLGVAAPGIAGRVDGRVAFEELGSERQGSVKLALRGGAFPPVTDVSGHLESELEGSGIDARAEVVLGGVGKAALEGAGSLERSVFDARALGDLTGKATLAISDLDLGKAREHWFGDAGVSIRGRGSASVRVVRAAPRSVPAIAYELETHELAFASATASGQTAPEVRVDIESAGELFGPQGSRLGLNLVDAQGPWIAATVEHALGAAELEASGGRGFAAKILDARVRARVTAYRRPLRMFGSAGESALNGSIAGEIGITGSARLPEVDASASVTGSGVPGTAKNPEVDIALRYSASKEEYTLEARTNGEDERLELRSKGRFGWLARGLGKDWSAEGELSATKFGVARLGRLVGIPASGDLSARASFDLDQGRAEAKGELELTELRVERYLIGSGSGRVGLTKGRLDAALHIGHAQSAFDLEGDTRLAWNGKGFELDRRAGGTLQAIARNFDLAVLRPFVRETAKQVGGRLNGRAELGWGPEARSGRRPTTLRTNATITDGTASLVAGGGLIQKLHVQALADGKGPLRLTFSGAARSREPNLKGSAVVVLDGPVLKRLDAEFRVDSFPLLFDGVLMGRATTDKQGSPLKVSIIAGDEAQTVEVTIPAIEVKLPPQTDKNLIALDDDKSIDVAENPLDPEEERKLKSNGGSTTLKVRLGNRVRVKRGGMDVPVGGAITMAPDGRLTGAIVIPSGVVPALGQIFRIRKGVVTFRNQEVQDGTLSIQATTRVADGTSVDVDVGGTIREPVITLTSDPPRSENEIVALLLGIQTDSTEGGEGEMRNTAVALAMNKLVEGSPLSGLQFGAGETGEGEAVSTVSVRVAQTVWLEGRSVEGNETSVNQDQQRVSGVIDWRFAPTWSLRGQLGDVSGVEIRWSFRY